MRPDSSGAEVEKLVESDEFKRMIRDEFPEDAAEWLDPVSRRQFVKLMGASVALAGAVGCNPSLKPMSRQKVLPYVKQPDEILPGIPLFFATSYPGYSGVSQGLLVKQTEGRPIKVEGNPDHPGSLGGTDLISQGTVLGLYDPDRSRGCVKLGTPYGFDKFLDEAKQLLDAQKPTQGAGIRFLTEPTTSPTLSGLIEEFLKRYPKAKWIQYEPVGRDAMRRGNLAAFGKHVNPVYKLDKAQVVLSLDCDFLSAAGVGYVRYSRDFMANRKVREVPQSIERGEGIPLEKMNRLYVIESMVTSTGAVADHRLPLAPSKLEDLARALAVKLGVAGVTVPAISEESKRWIDAAADDLVAHKGAALVLAGDTQPAAVHLIAHAINEKLGSFGKTVVFTEPLEPRPADGLAEVVALADDLANDKVELLFVMGVNPVYDAPTNLEFGRRMAESKATKIHLGLYVDETAADGQCTWHVNAAHYLETWGDARAYDGTVAIQQPLIQSLFNGKSPYDVFASLLDRLTNDPLDLVQTTWKNYFDKTVKKGDFQTWWEEVVRKGVIPGTALPAVTVSAVNLEKLNDKNFITPAPKGGVEVQFRPDLTLWDGRFANNGWLQELPKPITTLAWDCAAIVSPAFAEKIGATTRFSYTGGEHGHTIADVASVELDGRKLNKIPVLILPGHADNCVTLHLGHGRDPRRSGKVSGSNPSFNTYLLRTTTAYWTLGGAAVALTGEEYPLAVIQGHTAMEGRRPARHATVEQFKKEHEFAQIPVASAGEYKIIRSQTPGTPEDMERLKLGNPYEVHHAGHDHGHADEGHSEGEHHGAGTAADHDPRIIPLSLFPDYPTPYKGQQATISYRRWGLTIDLGACTGVHRVRDRVRVGSQYAGRGQVGSVAWPGDALDPRRPLLLDSRRQGDGGRTGRRQDPRGRAVGAVETQ